MSDLIENVSKESLRELLKKVYGYKNVEKLKIERTYIAFTPDKGRRVRKTLGDLRVETMVKFSQVGVAVNYKILPDGFELIFNQTNVTCNDVVITKAEVVIERKYWLEALYAASTFILK